MHSNGVWSNLAALFLKQTVRLEGGYLTRWHYRTTMASRGQGREGDYYGTLSWIATVTAPEIDKLVYTTKEVNVPILLDVQ